VFPMCLLWDFIDSALEVGLGLGLKAPSPCNYGDNQGWAPEAFKSNVGYSCSSRIIAEVIF
jgi:hypothetical protein